MHRPTVWSGQMGSGVFPSPGQEGFWKPSLQIGMWDMQALEVPAYILCCIFRPESFLVPREGRMAG